MKKDQIINAIQDEINAIHNDANDSLKSLNKKISDDDRRISNWFGLSKDYYINIARYAWGHRGSKIAAYRLQSVLNQIKKEIKES